MKQIALNNSRKVALVDDEDYEQLSQMQWNLSSTGYAVISFIKKGSPSYLHRIVLNAKPGQIIDHINRNRLDNQKFNLRICKLAENQFNTKLQKTGKSKYKGAYLSIRDYCYYSTGKFNNKTIGLFRGTELECAYAYDCFTSLLGVKAFRNSVEDKLSENTRLIILSKVMQSMLKQRIKFGLYK